MASPTQWIWVWASLGSWWWTGKPGVLQSSPWGRKDSDTTEGPNWTDPKTCSTSFSGAHRASLCTLKPPEEVLKGGRCNSRGFSLRRKCLSFSVVSDSLQPHGLEPTRLLCLWNSPGLNNGVGCHALLQRLFWTQGLSHESPVLQVDSLPHVPPGKTNLCRGKCLAVVVQSLTNTLGKCQFVVDSQMPICSWQRT